MLFLVFDDATVVVRHVVRLGQSGDPRETYRVGPTGANDGRFLVGETGGIV